MQKKLKIGPLYPHHCVFIVVIHHDNVTTTVASCRFHLLKCHFDRRVQNRCKNVGLSVFSTCPFIIVTLYKIYTSWCRHGSPLKAKKQKILIHLDSATMRKNWALFEENLEEIKLKRNKYSIRWFVTKIVLKKWLTK